MTFSSLWRIRSAQISWQIDLLAAFDTVDHVILLDVITEKIQSWRCGSGHGLTTIFILVFVKWMQEKFSLQVENLNVVYFQGSCAGPILYTAYASTLELVVLEADTHDRNMECEQYGESPQNCDQSTPVALHGLANDHALKNTYKAKSHTAEKCSVQTLERKAVDVKERMDANHLKMEWKQDWVCHFCIQTDAKAMHNQSLKHKWCKCS